MTRLDTIERLCRHSAVFRSIRRLQQLSGRPGWYPAHSRALAETLPAGIGVLFYGLTERNRISGWAARIEKMYTTRIQDPFGLPPHRDKPGILTATAGISAHSAHSRELVAPVGFASDYFTETMPGKLSIEDTASAERTRGFGGTTIACGSWVDQKWQPAADPPRRCRHCRVEAIDKCIDG